MRYIFSSTGLGGHRSALRGNTGARTFSEPGTVELVMPRGRTKVPHNWLIILREKGEACQLIHCPRSDMCRRDVAYIVHIEAEQRPHLRLFEQFFNTCKTLGAQPFKVYAFFPVYAHQAIGSDRHDFSPSLEMFRLYHILFLLLPRLRQQWVRSDLLAPVRMVPVHSSLPHV